MNRGNEKIEAPAGTFPTLFLSPSLSEITLHEISPTVSLFTGDAPSQNDSDDDHAIQHVTNGSVMCCGEKAETFTDLLTYLLNEPFLDELFPLTSPHF